MASAQWAERQSGLGFLGVHVDASDEAGRVFVEEYGWDFPVLSDSDWVQIGQWGISSHPVTVLVDEFGRIVGTFFRPAIPAIWDDMVAQLG